MCGKRERERKRDLGYVISMNIPNVYCYFRAAVPALSPRHRCFVVLFYCYIDKHQATVFFQQTNDNYDNKKKDN